MQIFNIYLKYLGTHFASPEAYKYHKQTKTQNQHSRSIPAEDFKKNVHHVSVHFRNFTKQLYFSLF